MARWTLSRRWLQFRLRTLLIGTAFIAIGLQSWLVFWGRPPFPSVDEVESIRVAAFIDLECHRFDEGYLVPESHWSRLLAALSDCREVSDTPEEWPDSLAVISIKQKNGESHYINANIDHRTGDLLAITIWIRGDQEDIYGSYGGHNAHNLLAVLREAQATGTPSPSVEFVQLDEPDEGEAIKSPSFEERMAVRPNAEPIGRDRPLWPLGPRIKPRIKTE